jgi:hypothetical protein
MHIDMTSRHASPTPDNKSAMRSSGCVPADIHTCATVLQGRLTLEKIVQKNRRDNCWQ